MPATFLTSDTHFGHARMVQNENRPWTDRDEMNEALIENWNKVVRPSDLIYHLGDVVMNRRYFHSVMPRLNGRKILIKGNHDLLRPAEYLEYFSDILSLKVMHDCILTHIPLAKSSVVPRFGVNVHGHTHKNRVQQPAGSWLGQIMRGTKNLSPHGATTVDDPHYICVCVEQTNYTPVSYEDIRKTIYDRFPR